MPAPPSLAGRAFLAMALMVGFYALAIGLAGFLLWLPYGMAMNHVRIPGKIAWFAIAGGGLILWSIVPRLDRFTSPGPRLLPEKQPRLNKVIQEVADATGQAMPAEVFLVLDVNAWVAQRGGFMGIGSKRIMGIGLALLQRLSVPELKGVLAHEFGHYHGGDTRLGPVIYQTRAAIGRTIRTFDQRGNKLLRAPFLGYGNLFLRITHGVSRQQEYTADALAARTVGKEHLGSALAKSAVGSGAFDMYYHREFVPVVEAGYRPPIAVGFQEFLTCESIVAQLPDALAASLEAEETDPHATHPSLSDRMEAIGVLPSSVSMGTESPAVDLLDDLDRLEGSLLEAITNREYAKNLKSIAWADVGDQVFLSKYEKTLRSFAPQLSGVTVGSLPSLVLSPSAFRSRVAEGFPDGADEDALLQESSYLLSSFVAAALARRGWKLETGPGLPITMVGPGGRLEPFRAIREIHEGTAGVDAWARRCAELRIADVMLGETAAAA